MSGTRQAPAGGRPDRSARRGASGRTASRVPGSRDRARPGTARRTAATSGKAGTARRRAAARRCGTSVGLGTSIGPTGRPVRSRLRWLAVTVATVIVIALANTHRSLLGSSVVALGHVRWRWVPLVLLAEVASKAAVAGTHRQLLRAGGSRLTFRSVLAIVYAGNAVSLTLPVVGAPLATAVNYREFSHRGAGQATAGWTLLVSGIASASAFAALVVAGAAVTGTGWGALLGAAGALLVAVPGWAAVALLGQAEIRRRLLVRADSLLLRSPAVVARSARAVRTALPRLLEQLGVLRLPGRSWSLLALLGLANWLADSLALAGAIAATGGAVPWRALLLVYLAGAGITTLALTPGGLGTVELGLTAALTAAGLDAEHALTATLAYRLVTLWLAAGAGWAAYAVLSRRHADHTPPVRVPYTRQLAEVTR